MNVGVIPILGTLAIGGLGAIAIGGPTTPPAAPPAPASAAIVQTNNSSGVMPVPSMGPPGAVAAVGANPMAGSAPGITIPPPAPLVAGKFLLPQGVRVTALPGSELARMYDAPMVVGLRPGYVFRFELTGLPYHTRVSLYPEVELHGVLVPRPGMKYMDYPIPLYFTQADIDQALKGVLITKVIYLEDPEKALPVGFQPDYPVETPDGSEDEAKRNANEHGRLMAIVRLGDRKPPIQELQTVAIPGTLLLPGERYLKAPTLPPVFSYFSVPLYDPLLGSRIPKEECFPNGGDKKTILGIGPDGHLNGLNATDVSVEFTKDGKRRVATSNMAFICAPRFLIRRAEEVPNGLNTAQMIAANTGQMGSATMKDRVAPMTDIAREKANEYIGRVRPSAYVGKLGASFFIGTSKPMAIAQVEGVQVMGALVEPEQLTASPSLGPLTVTKIIDPPGPKQSGDIVTITIRYANTGLKPVSELVVSDSLSGRLEYIPGSAETDRAANFTAEENEAGSVVMRWELPGELFPGQAGTIKFKVKIR
jgi:uncharacterized repeat protein (TIGR01451 family)